MQYPRNVDVWEYAPGRKLAEVVIRVKNVKGAVAKCSEAVSDVGVKVLTGFVTAPTSSPIATWSFFADITDSSLSIKGLKERLLGLPVVDSVQALSSEDGFVVDKQHFPVQWAGRRALILRADALSEMLDRLWNVFGTGAAMIVDQMAEAMGRHYAREVIEDFGKKFAVDHLEELLSTYAALGYAEVVLEPSKSSGFQMVLNAKELFECEANAKRKVRRRSFFFRAHLRGFVAGVFGSDVEVTEVQCLTEGDEACSFQIAVADRPLDALSLGATARKPASQSTF